MELKDVGIRRNSDLVEMGVDEFEVSKEVPKKKLKKKEIEE